VRRALLLTSIVCLILFVLASALFGSRYATGGDLFELATLAHQLGRPLVALIITAVLVARFRDIWARRVDLHEPLTSGIAKVAQGTGLVLMVLFFVVAVLLIALQVMIPASGRAELPIFFMFVPLLTALPVGYFLFELGRLIDKDRRDAAT